MTLQDYNTAMSMAMSFIKDKLEAQGHGTRGDSKLVDSMEFEVELKNNTEVIGKMLMEHYYFVVEKGVTPARIPYTPGVKRDDRSLYIEGLMRYWAKKGLSGTDKMSATFATARKQKEEGIPTRNSYRFSKDGTRLKFIEDTLTKYENEVYTLLENRITENIGLFFNKVYNNFEKSL